MSNAIHRSKTTGPDIFVYEDGNDLQVLCGKYERWFSIWPDDPSGSVFRAVDETARGAGVEVTEFSVSLTAA